VNHGCRGPTTTNPCGATLLAAVGRYVLSVGAAMASASPEFVPARSTVGRLRQHPLGFWFVFSGEAAERASYYGMRTILALYLTEVIGYSQAGGATVMKVFMAACYLTPFVGGVVAERWLGPYRTILYYSVPYVLGHVILGTFQSKVGLFTALALLAFGSGAIKPNTTVLMGEIYDAAGKGALLTEAFSYYYAAVNLGAAITSFGLPIIRTRYGYATALIIPAALMALAFAFFASGKRFYPEENVRARAARPHKTPEERVLARKTLLRIGSVFAMIAIFWLVYDQNADTWIYFADRHCNGTYDATARVSLLSLVPPLHVGGWGFSGLTITADQVQALNPIFIIVLTPAFNWLWSYWRRARGSEVPETRKMLIGFLIGIGCMVLMTGAGFYAQGTAKVSVWWVIAATFVITLAELCISVVGLEFAYKQAAPGTKSVVTAGFHATVFVGDSLALTMAPFYEAGLPPFAYFGLQTLLVAGAAVVFVPIARRFERHQAGQMELQA
jgi:POT family proton-dependent oligopeptide transporter